jgi:hypothetical protein
VDKTRRVEQKIAKEAKGKLQTAKYAKYAKRYFDRINWIHRMRAETPKQVRDAST